MPRALIVILLLPFALAAEDAPPPLEDPAPPAVEAAAPDDDGAADPAAAPAGVLVLDAATAAGIARANADRVLAAQAGRAATQAEARARFGQLLPQVRADAGYTRYEDGAPPVGGTGNVFLGDSDDRYTAGAELEQLLWSFGRVTGTLNAREALDRLSGADLLQAERDAAYRARIAVANVQLAAAQLGVATERVDQRRSELEDSQDRLAVGAVPELDVREARIVLITARNQQRAATAALERAYHELATALAIEDRELEVAAPLERVVGLEQLLDLARANIAGGPELDALRAQADLAAADRASERGGALPELYAVGAWRSEGPEVDDQDDGWRVGLSVSWSLYDGGSTWARVEAARNDRRRLVRLSDQQTRERLRQFDDVGSDLSSLDERIAEEEVAVELAAENYEDARDRYREGVIDRVRLGEANLQVTLARLRLIDLLHQEVTAAYLLMRLAE